MSARIITCRFAFLACVVVGVACANLIGIVGFWWKAGASDREVWRKYAEDATDYDAKPEEFRKATYFFEYTDVKRSRVHGWPFRCLWCDVITRGRGDLRVRATPWLFDGADVYELRVWPLVSDITVAIGMVTSAYWVLRRPRKRKSQFTLASLLGTVFAAALTLWTWLSRERFENSVAEALHYFGGAKEWLAWFGWYLAIATTFIALSCVILAALHTVRWLFSGLRKADVDSALSQRVAV